MQTHPAYSFTLAGHKWEDVDGSERVEVDESEQTQVESLLTENAHKKRVSQIKAHSCLNPDNWWQQNHRTPGKLGTAS